MRCNTASPEKEDHATHLACAIIIVCAVDASCRMGLLQQFCNDVFNVSSYIWISGLWILSTATFCVFHFFLSPSVLDRFSGFYLLLENQDLFTRGIHTKSLYVLSAHFSGFKSEKHKFCATETGNLCYDIYFVIYMF